MKSPKEKYLESSQAGAIVGNPQLALWHSFSNEAPGDFGVSVKIEHWSKDNVVVVDIVAIDGDDWTLIAQSKCEKKMAGL